VAAGEVSVTVADGRVSGTWNGVADHVAAPDDIAPAALLLDEGEFSVAITQAESAARPRGGPVCDPPADVCLSQGILQFNLFGGPGCAWHADIDWGDGTSDSIDYNAPGTDVLHTYPGRGYYEVSYTGSGTPLQPDITCTFENGTETVGWPLLQPHSGHSCDGAVCRQVTQIKRYNDPGVIVTTIVRYLISEMAHLCNAYQFVRSNRGVPLLYSVCNRYHDVMLAAAPAPSGPYLFWWLLGMYDCSTGQRGWYFQRPPQCP